MSFLQGQKSASKAPCIRGNAGITPLITADEHTRLLSNGQARAAGQDTDPVPTVRLFTPDVNATGCWRRRPGR
ncbi:DUF2958 domain-containing protein [Stenotrophomonas lactitubi]|uniref:DUF2958 domain-containing protein n=1 Tax=Stenotrophomonas lactitubi TaxID=2045214 RepID=UPI003D176A44